MNKELIKEAVRKAYLNEEESSEKKKKVMKDLDIECDEIISDIRKKLMGLKAKLSEMGIQPDSKPLKQVKRMYQLLADFDPVEVKLKEYLTPNINTQTASAKMMGEAGTIKIDVDTDGLDQKKAMDLANKYEKDVELLNKK